MGMVTPFLMFNGRVEEAVLLYTSLIPNSQVHQMQREGDGVRSATFTLDGREFSAFDGGTHFAFSEGLSLMIACETQAEVDRLWDALCADGGTPSQCGWLRDRFGLSWQIVPHALMRLMSDPDPAKAQRVVQAMLGMTKIVIADLEVAHAG